MKIEYLIILLFALASCKSNQFVNKNMVEIPDRKIAFTLDGKKYNYTVLSFYMSQYPETNLEYKTYLNSLSEDEKNEALPKKEFLTKRDLSSAQITFLVHEYYQSNAFNDYPIIALNKDQIDKYLEWKSEVAGKSILTQKGIEFDSTMTYFELVQQQKVKKGLLQPKFLVLVDSQVISAGEFMYLQGNQMKTTPGQDENINRMIRSLGIRKVEHYDLKTVPKFEELVYNPIDTADQYKSIHEKAYNIFETSEKLNALVPLRTWHVKL